MMSGKNVGIKVFVVLVVVAGFCAIQSVAVAESLVVGWGGMKLPDCELAGLQAIDAGNRYSSSHD